ncbi:MAG: flavodoxin [Actinomycetota bacterium]
MSRLLVVHQPRSPSVERLRSRVIAGARLVDDVEIESLAAPDAGIEDVEGADGLVLLVTANFGALSGLVKDLFERIYPWFEELPDRRPGLPYALVAKGTTDASGAVRDVERITTGLRWNEVLAPLVIEGEVTPTDLDAARELGATLAAGLDAGLW